MVELSLEYWNKLSSQFILMSVFLGGFSIALTANLLISKLETRLLNIILKLLVGLDFIQTDAILESLASD